MSGILFARFPTVDYVTDHKRKRGGGRENKREKDKKKIL